MAKYRAGVIGLGWMGMMYDLAHRPGPAVAQPRYDLDALERPTPELDVHRTFHIHDHPGEESLVTSYAEAFADRPDVELVAAAERDEKRLAVFAERYGATGLYTDAAEMLREARLDLVAIAINIAGRAELTALAVEHGVKGIVTEKPMVNSLQDADLMVDSCAAAGVPLMCGAITTSHPSFAAAKKLIRDGAIGDLLSIEATSGSQHQNWSYFMDSGPAWVVGTGDSSRRETGSDEFTGQGFAVGHDGLVVHFRKGAPMVRLTGSAGEMAHSQLQPWAPVAGRRGERQARAGRDAVAGSADRLRSRGGLRHQRRDRLHRGQAGRAQELRAAGCHRAGGGDSVEAVLGPRRGQGGPAVGGPVPAPELRLVPVAGVGGRAELAISLSPLQARKLRLRAQHLHARSESGVDEVVLGLCGVQVQDAQAAALAVRARAGGTAADVERARVERRSIVRTWAMRGTIHLMAAEDARRLAAPRGPAGHTDHPAPVRRVGAGRGGLRQGRGGGA